MGDCHKGKKKYAPVFHTGKPYVYGKVALATTDASNQVPSVSIKEIKSELDRMSAVDRAKIHGHLRILRWKESPTLAERLTQAHTAMDQGRKITAEEIDAHLVQLRAKKK